MEFYRKYCLLLLADVEEKMQTILTLGMSYIINDMGNIEKVWVSEDARETYLKLISLKQHLIKQEEKCHV